MNLGLFAHLGVRTHTVPDSLFVFVSTAINISEVKLQTVTKHLPGTVLRYENDALSSMTFNPNMEHEYTKIVIIFSAF